MKPSPVGPIRLLHQAEVEGGPCVWCGTPQPWVMMEKCLLAVRPKPLALIEFKVSIVAPEGALDNVRMDMALVAARRLVRFVSASVRKEVDDSPALDGFTVEVEVLDK